MVDGKETTKSNNVAKVGGIASVELAVSALFASEAFWKERMMKWRKNDPVFGCMFLSSHISHEIFKSSFTWKRGSMDH